ncbi:MAG: bifunctional ornithine acetyltransferase/N-acetylglutamate synthase, partial [Verrucomicrobia bacterium]|nr:bifunctional ornithine acetyltransferase/N-acetylglutamate synthase [Verrucomicrobiota bacterium]
MKVKLKSIEGSIVAPQGFLSAGVFCDIKRLGTGKGSNKGQKRDLTLIVSEVPAAVAGLFTTNQICAAPVKVCAQRVKKGKAQAIVVNSGNANACTGKQGMKDALEMTRLAAAQLHLPPEQVLVGSTGRIGVNMPMENVRAGIAEAAQLLGNAPEHADEAAEAIMTSDTRPKKIAVEFKLGGKTVRIGGICKGAGMIQPGMSPTGARPATIAGLTLEQQLGMFHATMLCFITTDVAIEAEMLQPMLNRAVAQSFNRITVDGDMSTNDTVLVLANGLAGNDEIFDLARFGTHLVHDHSLKLTPSMKRKLNQSFKRQSDEADLFESALSHVCLELAKMIVREGEGVHRVVTVRVVGAKTIQDADAAARAVANSALVKTSWHGGDPNWGRIIDALGYSAATVVEDKVDIGYSASAAASDALAGQAGKKILWSLKRGQPTKATFKELCAAAAPDEFDLHINLNLGKAGAIMYAADLTEKYV